LLEVLCVVAELTAAELRRALELAHELIAVLDPAPRDLRPGDREVAEELLPAWWLALGSDVVSMPQVREAPAGTELARVIDRFRLQYESPQKAWQGLGHLLRRVATARKPVAGYLLERRPGPGDSAMWVCSPVKVPQVPDPNWLKA
jgi:hypothetical protein